MTTLNQSEWIKRLRSIVKSSDSSQWALGDLLVAGTNEFGRKSYALACQATGYGRVSLYRIARTAAHFPTHLRLEYIAWSTFVLLRPFPLSFLEKFLPTIGGSDLSAKLIREKAVAEYGSDPEPYRKQKIFRNVRLSTELCDRIVERSGKGRVSGAVTQILKDYLAAAKSDGKASEAVAPSDGNEPAATQTCPPTPSPTEPEVETQTGRSGPKSYVDEKDGLYRLTNRPTYDQRRAEAIANGAEPIPLKKRATRKDAQPKLRLLWTTCGAAVSSDNGVVGRARGHLRATCFGTLEAAQKAEQENYERCGYREEIVACLGTHQGQFHIRHRFSSEVQSKSAAAS
jgi:hypothetical protein